MARPTPSRRSAAAPASARSRRTAISPASSARCGRADDGHARGDRAERDALARCLDGGGVALFGADTVYGLCCDPLDEAAVERLFALKGRARTKPARARLLLARGRARGAARARRAHPRGAGCAAARAADAALPNPRRRFPLAGGELLGVRVIDIGIELERAVLQSSANLAGGRDPRTLDEVPSAIRAGVDLEIDRGPLPGTPSTVVDLARFEAAAAGASPRRGASARLRSIARW